MAEETHRLFMEAELLLLEYRKSEGEQREIAKNKIFILLLGDMQELFINTICASKGFPKSLKEDLAWDYLEMVHDIIRHFDPEKGDLEHYFNFLWSRRARNFLRRIGVAKKTIKDDSGVKKTKYILPSVSLNDDVEDKISLGDKISQTTGVGRDPMDVLEGKLLLESYVLQLSALVTGMFAHGYSQKSSETKEHYFKLFFTERLVAIVKESELTIGEIPHERQIFRAVQNVFLDFFMKEICENIESIRQSPLKKYGDIGVEEGSELEIELKDISSGDIGFKKRGKVYYRYFCTVENDTASEASISSRITQRRKDFLQLDEILHQQFR